MTYDEQLHDAGEQAILARVYFDLYWVYWEREKRARYLPAFEDYSEFFRFNQHAHLTSFIIGIMRLFDRDRRSISFTALLSQKPNPQVDALLAAAEPVVEKVRLLRNKTMAHNDSRKSAEDWFKEADVTYNELRGLTETVFEAIDLLNVDNGWEKIDFHDLHIRDFEAMLEMMLSNPRH